MNIIKTLNEDELAMLTYIAHKFAPQVEEMTLNRILSYQFPALAKQIVSARKYLSEKGEPVYKTLCEKLSIPYDVELQPQH